MSTRCRERWRTDSLTSSGRCSHTACDGPKHQQRIVHTTRHTCARMRARAGEFACRTHTLFHLHTSIRAILHACACACATHASLENSTGAVLPNIFGSTSSRLTSLILRPPSRSCVYMRIPCNRQRGTQRCGAEEWVQRCPQRKLASGKRTRGDWGFGRGHKLTCCCSIAFFQMKPVRPPLAAKCPCLPIAPTELESAGSGACPQTAAPQQVETAVPPRDVLNSNDARQGRPVSVLASVRVEIELTTIDCLRSQDEDTLLPHSRAASIRERLYVRISRLGAGT